MKKTILFSILLLGTSLFSQATGIKNDTIKPLNPPIKLPRSLTQSIDFIAPIMGTYSIMIEGSGNVIDIDEVNLSANEVYTIDMSTLPAAAYRVVITDIIRGIEYEYFYRKEDNTEMI